MASMQHICVVDFNPLYGGAPVPSAVRSALNCWFYICAILGRKSPLHRTSLVHAARCGDYHVDVGHSWNMDVDNDYSKTSLT